MRYLKLGEKVLYKGGKYKIKRVGLDKYYIITKNNINVNTKSDKRVNGKDLILIEK